MYVFRRAGLFDPADPSDDAWGWTSELNPFGGIGVGFGFSLDICGDRLVVGAFDNDEACGGDPTCDSGAAYVFRLEAGLWLPEQKLLASDLAEFRIFGESVSISGGWISSGSVWDANIAVTGSAYLFRLDENGTPSDATDDFWVEHVQLTTPEGATGDRFGQYVALGEDVLVVGAPSIASAQPELAFDPGSAYVYRLDENGTPADRSDDQWIYQMRLAASDGEITRKPSCAGGKFAPVQSKTHGSAIRLWCRCHGLYASLSLSIQCRHSQQHVR